MLIDFSQANIASPSLAAAELEDLLYYLKKNKSVDLLGYKRESLMRRTLLRMQQAEIEDYQGYLDRLEHQPEELTHLLDTIFINVTYFFRDRATWDYLANQIIPQIIANKEPHEPIRVWSAGCASGEEAYSLAMLLAEALGIEQFQQRVRIYGTDADADVVKQARQGYYPAHAVETIPADLRDRYFECKTEGYYWRADLRHSIFFHCRDLLQSSPFPRIDLLVCRNTLIYFVLNTQIRALMRFHFSLKDSGFLLLGHSENLVNNLQNSLFTTVDRQARVFKKVPNAHRNPQLLAMAFGRKK